MSETFKEAVAAQLNHDNSILVVDNYHAYARIEQRVRTLWDGLCLLGENNLTLENLLSLYAGVASMAQHAAESVHAAELEAVSPPIMPDDKDLLIKEMHNMLFQIIQGCKPAKQIQIGSSRHYFEFDQKMYKKIMEIINK